MSILRLLLLACIILSWRMAAAQEPYDSFSRAYHYERIAVDYEAALNEYRLLLRSETPLPRDLEANVIYRIGCIQADRGRLPEARATLQRLLFEFSDLNVLRKKATAKIALIDQSLDSVLLKWHIKDPDGNPVKKAFVMLGSAESAIILVTDESGNIESLCPIIHDETSGGRFVSVYIDSPLQKMSAYEVVVPDDSGVHAHEVTLKPYTSITGRVIDHTDKPVEGIQLSLYPQKMGVSNMDISSFIGRVNTLSNGVFAITGLPSGYQYLIQPSSLGVTLESSAIADCVLPGKPVEISLRVQTAGQGKIHGYVVDDEGRGVRTTVRIYPMKGKQDPLVTQKTSPEGYFSFEGLPDDSFRVHADETPALSARWLSGVSSSIQNEMTLRLKEPRQAGLRTLTVGDRFPALDLNLLTGGSSPSSLYSGSPIIYYFWRRDIYPVLPVSLLHLQKSYASKGVSFVIVHDHSGIPAELLDRPWIRDGSFLIAIDSYYPRRLSANGCSTVFTDLLVEKNDLILVDRNGIVQHLASIASHESSSDIENHLQVLTSEKPGSDGMPLLRQTQDAVRFFQKLKWIKDTEELNSPPDVLWSSRFIVMEIEPRTHHAGQRDVGKVLGQIYGPKLVSCFNYYPGHSPESEGPAPSSVDGYSAAGPFFRLNQDGLTAVTEGVIIIDRISGNIMGPLTLTSAFSAIKQRIHDLE